MDPKESRHALCVLRLETGDAVDLVDGKGHKFLGVVAGIENKRVKVLIDRNLDARPVLPEISLVVSVVKPERMDLIIQKACELGAHSLFPLVTERCVIRISKERWVSKAARWRRIAVESCKQCGRPSFPEIHEVQLYEDFIRKLDSSYSLVLIPTLAKPGRGLYDILKREKVRNALILIGPEGDFTAREVEFAVSQRAAEPVNLGPLVMRTETAALYALSVVQFFMREINGDSKHR